MPRLRRLKIRMPAFAWGSIKLRRSFAKLYGALTVLPQLQMEMAHWVHCGTVGIWRCPGPWYGTAEYTFPNWRG